MIEQYWLRPCHYKHGSDISEMRYRTISIDEEDQLRKERARQLVIVRHRHICPGGRLSQPAETDFELRDLSPPRSPRRAELRKSTLFYDRFSQEHEEVAGLLRSVIEFS
jgi:hypothetical protein